MTIPKEICLHNSNLTWNYSVGGYVSGTLPA